MQMGAAHAKAGEQEAAEAAYSKAHELCTRIMKDLTGAGVPEAQRISVMTACMALILDRLTNAWKLHQVVSTLHLPSCTGRPFQRRALPADSKQQATHHDCPTWLQEQTSVCLPVCPHEESIFPP